MSTAPLCQCGAPSAPEQPSLTLSDDPFQQAEDAGVFPAGLCQALRVESRRLGRKLTSEEAARIIEAMSETLSDEELAEIRERERKATAGPWKYAEVDVPQSELGRAIGFDGFKEQRIQTEWSHGQLQGPQDITMLSVSPYREPSHCICIDREDGEFIAHARTDVPKLLSHISTLQHQLDSLKANKETP